MNFAITSPTSLPAPVITTLSQARATAGAAGFTLNVTGSNFVPCSVVEWNGSGRPTTFSSATQLSTAISAADIASVGTAQVRVSTPTPGGGTSSGIAFSIVSPTITGLVPSSTPYCCTADLSLIVNGTDFVNALVVTWNGSPRPTMFVSPTQLTATISASDTAFPGIAGTAAITVSSSDAKLAPSASHHLAHAKQRGGHIIWISPDRYRQRFGTVFRCPMERQQPNHYVRRYDGGPGVNISSGYRDGGTSPGQRNHSCAKWVHA